MSKLEKYINSADRRNSFRLLFRKAAVDASRKDVFLPIMVRKFQWGINKLYGPYPPRMTVAVEF
jgi:hypothetical protein